MMAPSSERDERGGDSLQVIDIHIQEFVNPKPAANVNNNINIYLTLNNNCR